MQQEKLWHPLDARNKKRVIIPVFIPHKGCPFDCIYCNQKSISGQQEEMNLPKMTRIIETHLNSIQGNPTVEIAFYGGSFTGIPDDQQNGFLSLAYQYIQNQQVHEIRLSTRPDYIRPQTMDRLRSFGVKTVELGVQSLDEAVLKQSCRGHSAGDVEAAAAMVKAYGFQLGIQTMVGLPGDDFQKDMDTARKVIALRPDFVRIYPTLVIRGTGLEKRMQAGEFKPMDLEEAVELCAELLALYKSRDIPVIRVGLQPTDTIQEGMDVAVGPFHPAFRQLAESRLCLNRIKTMLEEHPQRRSPQIKLLTGIRNISNVVGQKRINLSHFKEIYGFKEILVIGDPALGDEIQII